MEPLGFPFNFVILIILISTIGGVMRAYLKGRGNDAKKENPRLEMENQELRKEVEQMRDRLHVLERITVEKENSLSQEIERLRDEPTKLQ